MVGGDDKGMRVMPWAGEYKGILSGVYVLVLVWGCGCC